MTIRSPLLSVAVVAALALGACGSSDDGGGSGTGGSGGSGRDKAFAGALKFAKCMRDHGIDMPDPQRVGKGGVKLSSRTFKGSEAKMQAAQKVCAKYMDVGGGDGGKVDPKEAAERKNALLAYSKCMRDEGVAMPDPEFSNGGATVRMGGPGSKINPNSPKFKAADKVCHPKIAAMEAELGGSGG